MKSFQNFQKLQLSLNASLESLDEKKKKKKKGQSYTHIHTYRVRCAHLGARILHVALEIGAVHRAGQHIRKLELVGWIFRVVDQAVAQLSP